MTINSSDVIKAAQQIADLENSDFISWNENIRLLNEAWTSIHQKLINKGDKTFIDEFEIERGINQLPSNFYQVYSITTIGGDILVPRYNIGMTKFNVYYDIKNGCINLHGTDNAKCVYFTKPQFLTYTNNVISNVLNLEEDEHVVFAKGEYVLTNKNVYSLSTGEVVHTLDKEYKYIDTWGNVSNDTPLFLPDGRTIFLNSDMHEYNGIQLPYDEYYTITTPDGYSFYCEDKENNDIYLLEDGQLDKLDGKYYTNYYFDNEHIFYVKKDNNVVYVDDIPLWDSKAFKGPVHFLKLDMNTGYGFYADNCIYSIAVDTKLNVPNNLYYNILAYQLAFNYCCKQGKDPSLVATQLNNNIEVLYDTLSNDNFNCTKVTNVYMRTR